MAKKNLNLSKNQIFLLSVLGIVLVLLLICYLLVGMLLTIFFGVGIGVILLLARVLDKIKHKPKQRKIFNIFMIIFLIIAIVICMGIVGAGAFIIGQAPPFDISLLDKREASIFYDKDGKEITRVGRELRENVAYDDLPEVFIDALIATEDARFFQHNGFDAPRFVMATFGQLSGDRGAGGASTLSMQVIKNTFTSTDASIMRKFTDIYLSIFKLERNYNKEQIIEFYVNNHELGMNSFGVEQAAQTYFNKSVRDLNLSESAILVGMFNAPTFYNPFNFPERTFRRRQEVLNLMVKHGYITRAERDAANSIPIDTLIADRPTQTLAFQSYVDAVIEELISKYGIDPYVMSVDVYTNMDRERQQKIDDIFNGKTYTWINDSVQSGVAVTDIHTGKIIALGGGRNKTTPRSFNFATQGKRQTGSAAKSIFSYGPVIEYNKWSTHRQILDEPYTYSNGRSINNADRTFMGPMSLRTALSLSRNIPALKAFQAVEQKNIIEFSRNLGIEPEIDRNGRIHEAHSLGAYDGTTPLMMAAAYAAFGNGGTYIEPLTVNRIVWRDNGDVRNAEPITRQAMSDYTAYMITDILITSVQSGLSSGARLNGVNLAAKTGTSSFDNATKTRHNLPGDAVNDSWIVGYDAQYAISMWYGYERITNAQHVLRAVPAVIQRGNLYRALGNAIFEKNNKEFPMPSSVVKVGVERGSNPPVLPGAGTPAEWISHELFIKGTEPTEVSINFGKLPSVPNLKVTYSETTETVNITWDRVPTPSANASHGRFGYNVYYGNVFLGFTQNNSFSVEASSSISGTYRVITTFSNFTANQSDPATFNFQYVAPTPGPNQPQPSPNPGMTFSLVLVGDATIYISTTARYNEFDPPVRLMSSNGTEVTYSSVSWTITDASNNRFSSLNGTTTPLTRGTYTITYTVNHNNREYKISRRVIVQ